MQLSRLNGVIKLSSKISVYIPSTNDVDKEIDNKEYVDECVSIMSDLFGGATSTPCIGFWKSKEKGLVRERTTMAFAYCTDKDLDTGINTVLDFCESMRDRLKQESVAIEINGELYLV
jgi:hypothetical protein